MGRCNQMFPTLPEGTEGVLPRYWIVNFTPNAYNCDQFTNAFCQWDDIFRSLGKQDSTILRAARWDPSLVGDINGFRVFPNQTSDVRMGGTNIMNPGPELDGVWIVGEDRNNNGILDFLETGR